MSRPIVLGCALTVALAVGPLQLRGDDTAGQRFDVPAGEATVTLRQFSAQAGVQLLVSSDNLRGVTTLAVHGSFTPLAALQQMLASTRLIAREDRSSGAIAVVVAPPPRKKDEGSNAPNKPKESSGMKAIHIVAAVAGSVASIFSNVDAQPVTPKEEVLSLDQFVVSSTAASGYRATNSISATGIGAPIGETPTMINVVTKPLIDDARLDLVIDALRFVPGVTTQSTNESQPFVRGFQGTYVLRNGVFRRQNLNTWNVDNVEVVQGPSSIFYSNIRPGGVINYNTIKPVFGRNFGDASVTTGTYGYFRSELGLNAGNDKLALRLDAGYLSQDTFRLNNHIGGKFVSMALSWKITPNHLVTLEAATESISRSNSWSAYFTPATNSRYFKNPVAIASGQTLSQWMAVNYPGMPLYDQFAAYGAPGDPYGRVTPIINSYQSGLDRPIDLSYVGKITDNLVVNAVANYAWEDNEGINPLTSDPMADGTIVGVRPERFVNVRDSYNLNARVTYRFKTGKVQHTLMAGDDNQWVVQRYPQVSSLAFPSSPANPITVSAANMRASSTVDYNALTSGPINGFGLIANSTTPFNSLRDTLQEFGGAYVVEQAVLLNRTLFLVAGDRYTTFRQHVWWPFRSDLERYAVPDAKYNKWTPQFGGLYKVGGGPISVYYTHSQALVPQTQIDASGNTVNPITSTGWDAGLKLDLLGGSLTGTLAYYSIYQTNTAISDAAANLAHGLPSNATYGYYTYGNAQRVRGIQADVNYNITQDYQLVVGYHHFLESDYVAPNSNAQIIGLPIGTLPPTSITVWNRYRFPSGPLKGLTIGGGARHNSRTIVAGGNFNYSQFYTAQYTVYDSLIGYDTKFFERPFKLAVNAKNLTNKVTRDPGGAFGEARTILFTASTHY